MRRIERLKRKARSQCNEKMHSMRRFRWDIKGHADPRAKSKCRICGAEVIVDHEGSLITGPAPTTNCKQMSLF